MAKNRPVKGKKLKFVVNEKGKVLRKAKTGDVLKPKEKFMEIDEKGHKNAKAEDLVVQNGALHDKRPWDAPTREGL